MGVTVGVGVAVGVGVGVAVGVGVGVGVVVGVAVGVGVGVAVGVGVGVAVGVGVGVVPPSAYNWVCGIICFSCQGLDQKSCADESPPFSKYSMTMSYCCPICNTILPDASYSVVAAWSFQSSITS